jgi:hypothetical protein
VYSPTYLFILPGALLTLAGFLILLTVLARVDIFGRQWDFHTMIGGSMLTIVGTQILALGLCARAYGVFVLGERDPWFDRMRQRVRLEHGLLAGAALLIVGLALGGVIVAKWIDQGGGQLSEARLGLLAATLVIVGIQVFFSSFLLSILGLRRRG